MIIIKIPIQLTDEQLATVAEVLKIRAISSTKLLSNGKSVDREETLQYQMLLILIEKFAKKLMKTRLHPNKKKAGKVTLTYPEANYLNKFLIEAMNDIENSQLRSMCNNVIMKIDPML